MKDFLNLVFFFLPLFNTLIILFINCFHLYEARNFPLFLNLFTAVSHLDYLGVQVAWLSGPWFLSIYVNMLPWESGEAYVVRLQFKFQLKHIDYIHVILVHSCIMQ